MRLPSALTNALAVGILLLASSSLFVSAADTRCNVAFTKVHASRAKNGVTAGKTFSFSTMLKNTGSTRLGNLYFQIELEGGYMVPVKTTGSKQTRRGSMAPLMDEQFIVFRKLTLPIGRKSLQFRVTIGVKSCQPSGTVQLNAVAYQLDADGDVTCSTTTNPYKVKVVRGSAKAQRASRQRGRSSWDDGSCVTPTPSPSVDPDYVTVGSNQRCLEARLLGTRDRRRRRRDLEQGQEQGLVKSKVQKQKREGRRLVTYTPDECYVACGADLQVPAPYYFNVDTSGNCYCCPTCLRIYDPNFTVSHAHTHTRLLRFQICLSSTPLYILILYILHKLILDFQGPG